MSHLHFFPWDPQVNQILLHILDNRYIRTVKSQNKKGFPVHIYCQSITDLTKTIPKNETQVQSSSNTLKLLQCSQTSNYSHVQKKDIQVFMDPISATK